MTSYPLVYILVFKGIREIIDMSTQSQKVVNLYQEKSQKAYRKLEKVLENNAYEALLQYIPFRQARLKVKENNTFLLLGIVDLLIKQSNRIICIEIKHNLSQHACATAIGQLSIYEKVLSLDTDKPIVKVILCNTAQPNSIIAAKLHAVPVFNNINDLVQFVENN